MAPPLLSPKSDYLFVFEVSGLSLLVSDLIMQSYGPFGEVILYSKGLLREYSLRSQWSQSSRDGLKLYSSSAAFKKYSGQLADVFAHIDVKLDATLTVPLTSTSVEQFFGHTKLLLDLYLRLSPMFTDQAVENSANHPALAERLRGAAQLKEPFRSDISRLFLQPGNYLERLVKALSEQHRQTASALSWYTIADLHDLFSGRPLDTAILEERRFAFVQIGLPHPDNIYGEAAAKLMAEFDQSGTHKAKTVSGQVANRPDPAVVRGRVKILHADYGDPAAMAAEIRTMHSGDILIAQTTTPELIEACRKAAAIVTDVGGLLSHAAIVSREFGTPCIVGTGNASTAFADGDVVVVDTNSGTVKLADKQKHPR